MQYKKRFTMPGGHESMFYSWNMGPVHFIGVNTEVYYDPTNVRNDSILEHYNWLQNDLQVDVKHYFQIRSHHHHYLTGT